VVGEVEAHVGQEVLAGAGAPKLCEYCAVEVEHAGLAGEVVGGLAGEEGDLVAGLDLGEVEVAQCDDLVGEGVAVAAA